MCRCVCADSGRLYFCFMPSPLPVRKSLKPTWQERVACSVTRHLALFSRVPCTNSHKHTRANSACTSIGTFYKNSQVHRKCRLLKYHPDIGQEAILSFCTAVGTVWAGYLVSGTATLWHPASLLTMLLEESRGTTYWSHLILHYDSLLNRPKVTC